MRKIEGIVYKHGKDDYEYCDGFNLTTQEEGDIERIVSNHRLEGFSVRGKKDDILKEIVEE